jgi:acetylornithine deacetylase/succinyl-diaminopimelate desuccinylase-like protein
MNIRIEDIRNEAVQMLQELIRINTSNPPGNEMQAVSFIEKIADKSGIEYEIMETAPGRGNIILKIPGTRHDNPLIMLSHLDVVGANKTEWIEDPFGGEIKDGLIWGRGAVDTKQLTAMELMTLLLIKRNSIVPDRDIYMIATSDEESGSKFGMLELLQKKGGIFNGADVISEGGGFPIRVGDNIFYICETGQKGSCTVRFKFRRKPGGNPYYPDNSAITSCSELIKRVSSDKWDAVLPETTKFLIDLLAASAEIDEKLSIQEKLEQLKEAVSPQFANILKAMTKNTMAVTMWRGGKKNCGPDFQAEAYADIRLLPGVTLDQVNEKIYHLTEGLEAEWEILSFSSGYDSNYDGALFRELNNTISVKTPGYKVVPFIATGASDGRLLGGYDCRVYGFSPVLESDMTFEKAVSMVHGINERISIDSLIFGIDVLFTTVLNYCGGGVSND